MRFFQVDDVVRCVNTDGFSLPITSDMPLIVKDTGTSILNSMMTVEDAEGNEHVIYKHRCELWEDSHE